MCRTETYEFYITYIMSFTTVTLLRDNIYYGQNTHLNARNPVKQMKINKTR